MCARTGSHQNKGLHRPLRLQQVSPRGQLYILLRQHRKLAHPWPIEN